MVDLQGVEVAIGDHVACAIRTRQKRPLLTTGIVKEIKLACLGAAWYKCRITTVDGGSTWKGEDQVVKLHE